MRFNANYFVLFILFLFPLVGSLSFLCKFLIKKVVNERVLHSEEVDRKPILIKMFLIILLFVITLCLVVFDFLICFVPAVKFSIFWKISGYVGLSIYWLFFGSLCMGLHKVIGAGYGSSTTILKSISEDINKEFDDSINKHKKK